MKFTTPLAAGALMVALAAVPAVAEAQPVSNVRTQAVAADRSIDRVVSLVRSNRDGAAARELARYRRHLRGAEREVRSLRRTAHTAAGAKRYGNSVRLVGKVANECADALAKVVDDAAGDPQVAIAKAISACIITRERVLEALTALLDEVPAEARPYISQVISMLSSDGQDEVVAITNVLEDPTLPTDVTGILTGALGLATGAINEAIGRLQGIVGLLPAPAQPIVREALTLVSGQLTMVTGLIRDLFGGFLGGTTPGTGTGTGGLGGLGGLLGGSGGGSGSLLGGGIPGIGMIQGILGGLLGGGSGGLLGGGLLGGR